MNANQVIRSKDEITLDWLRARVGEVESFDVQPVNEGVSNVYRVQTPAHSWIFKISTGGFGRSEVDYLMRDYLEFPDAPVPRCIEGAFDPETNAYHLLMEDLGATHQNNWQTTPTPAYVTQVAQEIARLHAYVWGREAIAQRGYTPTTAAGIQALIEETKPGLEPMLAELATDLPADWPALIRTIMETQESRMIARLSNPVGYTLLHGDLNPGNILSPHAPSGRTYFLDRQPFDWSLTTWLAASDLVYAAVTWWPTESRAELEEVFLRAYHDALLAYGIADYTWEQLRADYQLCIAESLFVAIRWCTKPDTRERMKWLWSEQVKRAMNAYLHWAG